MYMTENGSILDSTSQNKQDVLVTG